MKKIFIGLCMLSFGLNASAQLKETPLQATVKIKPDYENPEGCVLTNPNVRHVVNEQELLLLFNFAQLQPEEDVQTYFEQMPEKEGSIALRNNEILARMLSKEFSEEPLRLDGTIMLNGRHMPAMFEVVKKKDKDNNVYSELTFAVALQSIGINRIGELRMVVQLRAL